MSVEDRAVAARDLHTWEAIRNHVTATERRLGMTEQTNQDGANVKATQAGAILAKAQAIRHLVDCGFTHDSAAAACNSGDFSGLAKA